MTAPAWGGSEEREQKNPGENRAQERAGLEPLRIICPPRAGGCQQRSDDEQRSEEHEGPVQRRVGGLSATRAELTETLARQPQSGVRLRSRIS
jgi:hypothetical protein